MSASVVHASAVYAQKGIHASNIAGCVTSVAKTLAAISEHGLQQLPL